MNKETIKNLIQLDVYRTMTPLDIEIKDIKIKNKKVYCSIIFKDTLNNEKRVFKNCSYLIEYLNYIKKEDSK